MLPGVRAAAVASGEVAEMRQTWDEQREAQDDYLRLLRRMKDGGYTPHSEVRRLRRRCWLLFGIAVLEALVIDLLCCLSK